jgi:hypothetical protein
MSDLCYLCLFAHSGVETSQHRTQNVNTQVSMLPLPFCDFSIGIWNVPTVWYVLLLSYSYRIRPFYNILFSRKRC